MKTTKTLLAAAVILIACAGYSRAAEADPTAGTYQDKSLTIPQRVQLARAVIEEGATGADAGRAAIYILGTRPVIHAVAVYPEFVDLVLADPTLSGKIEGRSVEALKAIAVGFKAETIPTDDGRIAYLADELAKATPGTVDVIRSRLAAAAARKADKLNKAGDYPGAIHTVKPYLGFSGGTAEIKPLFAAKRAMREPEALSWAKLLYVLESFSGTQAGIDAVSSAYRALDANLVRANAFIEYQKTGAGENPLKDVPLPEVKLLGVKSGAEIGNLFLAGEHLAALNFAVRAFASAPAGPKLNDATSQVARCLRNIDGNLVRANEFVSAQTEGRAFKIAELE